MFSYISLIFSHLHQTCIGGPRQANSPSLQAALLAPRLAPSGSWRLSGPSPRALAPGSPFIPADSPSPKTRSGWHITAGSMSRARSRGPPCGHLACPHPDDSGGQWYCLPRDHGKCATPGASSVCKRPVCRRHFGMLGEKGKPGRKKAGVSDAKVAGNEQTMPANYILKKVHDIVGCRCARRCACPLAHVCRADRLLCARARRIVDISQLDAEERAGNPLKNTVLEYAVRGHFLMSKNDKYGKHTTLYVDDDARPRRPARGAGNIRGQCCTSSTEDNEDKLNE